MPIRLSTGKVAVTAPHDQQMRDEHQQRWNPSTPAAQTPQPATPVPQPEPAAPIAIDDPDVL